MSAAAPDAEPVQEEDPFERLLREAVEAEGRSVRRARRTERETVRRRGPRGALVAGLCTVGIAGLAVIGLGIARLGADEGESQAAETERDPSPSASASAEEKVRGLGASEPDQREVRGEGEGAMLDVDPSWATGVAREAGIPERAFRAYAGAALTIAEEQPGCGLGWNTLAAIGFVETQHGTIHGSTMGEDGRVSPRVYGVQLDGTEFDAIPDTDGGSIDGDPQWDRAVGPMQFLPQTWEEYGRDANVDGRIDIDQIDDVALSAATMLCEVGGDLSVPENWIAAVNAYNPNVSYNNDVVEAADYYGQFG